MTTTNYGGVPDAVTPENDEGIVTGQGNNPQKDSSNSADFTASANQIANQIAHLALAGHTVIRGDRGDFTVCKFGLTRYCAVKWTLDLGQKFKMFSNPGNSKS